MESSKILAILLVIVATTISFLATPTNEELLLKVEEDYESNFHGPKSENVHSIRGTGRFLARAAMTCDTYPRVCGAKGSPGPDCCRKQCVNVMTDRLNCGKCGNKCKYLEMCCQGLCVNPNVDEKHCGQCNNKCNKGSSCGYGLCSYS